MQVPVAQDVMVQVTSEGKALVEVVQEVLLLLLLMACGETSDATMVWRQRLLQESDVLFLLDGMKRHSGWAAVQLCLSLATTWGRSSG
jgi:hypothetical protein